MYSRLALVALLTLTPAFAAAAGAVVDAAAVYQQVQRGERVLIDVRSPGEWRQTGLAEGATPITIHDPGGMSAFVQNILDRVDGKRDTPVALICASGVRSTYAQQLLRKAGFSDVVNVREGMLGSRDGPGWVRRGLPVEACKSC